MATWLVLVGLIAVGWWWSGRSPEAPPSLISDSTHSVVTAGTVTVHVGGWVARPGLVGLPAGSRVADAIAAAGGSLPGGLMEAINLAEPVVDGMQVLVPGPETPLEGTEGSGSSPGEGPLHLNRATAAELDNLPGIGPVIAERIVAHRTEHGPFRAVEDLLDVPGIGEAKLASLRDLVVP